MQRQRRQDTLPELALRQALHTAGYRYRVNFKVPGSPRRTIDIAFTRPRVAVFIDGCFWHGCPEHYSEPKTRRDFWSEKISGNRQRDEETTRILVDQGWTVVRYWEHELSAVMFADLSQRLHGEVTGRRVETTTGSNDGCQQAPDGRA